ncbi:MAG: hypothetical protein ACI8Z1_001939 [Candidatus Azotimanducaceae bacterium]|jgi:hypothetical protein
MNGSWIQWVPFRLARFKKLLKRDEARSGARLFIKERACKPFYSALVQCDAGVLRLAGVRASATTKSSLETIRWL